MARITYITPELPYPAVNGGRLKSLNFIKALATEHDVTLCCGLKGDDATHLESFKALGLVKDIYTQPIQRARSARNLLLSYLRGQTLNQYRSFHPKLAQCVARAVAHTDLVVVDHYEAGALLPRDYQGPLLYHAHNAYFKLWSSYAQRDRNWPRRLAANIESMRVAAAERHLVARASRVFAAPNDIQALIDAGALAERFEVTYHLGDPSALGCGLPEWEQTEPKLTFVGYLGWKPNAQGLAWFIRNVWPRVTARVPEGTLSIAGAGADDALLTLARADDRITMHGFVEELEDAYQGTRVSVAPILFGSGMKVKVLDAMARGLPVATTPIGAEGIAAQPGIHLTRAANPSEMAESIETLLRCRHTWSRMSMAARDLVTRRYTYSVLMRSHLASVAQLVTDDARNDAPSAHAVEAPAA